jgi:hypothetical protein
MPICSCGYIQEDKKLAWSYTTSDQKEACHSDFSDWIYVVDKNISQLLNLFLGPRSHPPSPLNGKCMATSPSPSCGEGCNCLHEQQSGDKPTPHTCSTSSRTCSTGWVCFSSLWQGSAKVCLASSIPNAIWGQPRTYENTLEYFFVDNSQTVEFPTGGWVHCQELSGTWLVGFL